MESSPNPSDEQLSRVFRALGDPTRRALLARLQSHPARITDLASDFEMSLPAVGKHIRVLQGAGLISRTIKGREHICSLNAQPLASADAWLKSYAAFWSETLESLVDHFSEASGK